MRAQTEQAYKKRILQVLVHIQKYLDEALSLEDLARIASFSPYHFHRIFRGMVGESVKEHVRRLRLERAAHRLKFSDQPVIRIALDAGYETHEAFTRAFRAMFDASPSQFREAHQALPFPNVPSQVHFTPDGRLDDFHLLKGGGPAMEVRVERVAPMPVAFMRHVGSYGAVGQTWGKLMAWAGPRGWLGPRMTLVGMVHDDPEVTPPDKVRYDAGLVVDERFQPEGDVGLQRVGDSDYAVTTHRGPYERLGETYARLCGEWLPTSGREVRSGPCLEFYRNSPLDTAPQDLLTDIYMPLEER